VGSSTIRLLITQLVVVGGFAIGMAVSWPDVPWDRLLYGGIALAVAVPCLIHRHAKVVHLAIDLAVHPPEESDLDTPRERGFASARNRRTGSV
jgi:hypothetical protein